MRDTKGITLIGLVVTVIIILIVSGVTLNIISSEDGILGKVRKVYDVNDEVDYETKIIMLLKERKIANYTEEYTSLYDYFKNAEGIEGVEKSDHEELIYVTYRGEIWSVDVDERIVKDKLDLWDGTIDTRGFYGAGTEQDPYQIYTAEQLAYVAQEVNNGNDFSGKYFKLNNSLDLDNLDWIPIGGYAQNETTVTGTIEKAVFNGKFDGGNNKIYNIKAIYADTAGVGLFGASGVDSKIANLNILNGEIESRLLVGGICGVNQGVIENCNNAAKVTARSLNGENKNGNYAGGITGDNLSTGDIIGCSNSGDITSVNGTDKWNGGWAAGIAGISQGDISDCSNSGNIKTKYFRAGGIVGTLTIGTIKNCTNTGDVYSGWRGAGGIVGICCSGAEISDCENYGYISAGTDEAGGIAGALGDENNPQYCSQIRSCTNNGEIQTGVDWCGGITGYAPVAIDIIDGCTNNGKVTALNDSQEYHSITGGIVGHCVGTIKNCTNNGEVILYGQVIGGIVGRHYGVIENCKNTGNVTLYTIEGSDTSGLYTGGICGLLKETEGIENKILGCVNEGNVIGKSYTSGIVGAKYSTEVKDCINKGKITGGGYTAGIIGYNISGNTSNCNNEGDITGGSSTSGIIAYNSAGDISNCNNKGIINGTTYTAGVVGLSVKGNLTDSNNEAMVTGTNYMGGVIGYNGDGNVSNCKNLADVNGVNYMGGVLGYNVSGDTTNCKNDAIIQGKNYMAGVIGVNKKGTISNCTSSKDVKSIGNVAGGICSWLDKTSVIKNCENRSNVSSTSFMTAGIAGKVSLDVTVTECKNYGDISADHSLVGGIAGYCQSGISYCENYGKIYSESVAVNASGFCPNSVGGIVGNLLNGTVEYVYNEGEVSIKNNAEVVDAAGGIVGHIGSTTATSEPLPSVNKVYNKGKVICDEYIGAIVGQQLYENKVSNSYYLSSLNIKGIGFIGSDILTYTPTDIDDATNGITAITDNFDYAEFIEWVNNGG